MRIVCLISGGGSNLQSIIDAERRGELGLAHLIGVISNNPDAPGLIRATSACIPTHVLSHLSYSCREAFEFDLTRIIDEFHPDLLVLAGFMQILTKTFVDHYQGRIINIHPSLLPKYKGLDTHQRAINAGDKLAGASIHWVTTELDAGEVIIQVTVPIFSNDTAETLKLRVLQAEHRLYPKVIRDLAKDFITS